MIPVRFITATIETRPCTHDSPCAAGPHEWAIYRLVDGTEIPEPAIGDVYIDPWALRRQEREGTHSCPWTNCDGKHLWCALPPNGHPWNIDGRCSNCAQKDETTHRCWVRHGDPSVPSSLHVDKAGHTCNAGGGSIATDGYHGHLHNGALT